MKSPNRLEIFTAGVLIAAAVKFWRPLLILGLLAITAVEVWERVR